MKLHKPIFLALLLGITLLFPGCKGFEDGPLFSLTTVENRVTGTWVPTEYTLDGVDLLYQIDSAYTDSSRGLLNPSFYFYKNEISGDYEVIFTRADWIGYWGLGNKNKSITIGFYHDVIPRAIWKIQRLTQDEFWLASIVIGNKDSATLKFSRLSYD